MSRQRPPNTDIQITPTSWFVSTNEQEDPRHAIGRITRKFVPASVKSLMIAVISVCCLQNVTGSLRLLSFRALTSYVFM